MPWSRCELWPWIATLAVAGCSGGGDSRDAGVDGSGDEADAAADAGPPVPEPAPPAPPAAPVLEPCPAGWIARDDEAPVVCAAWPARVACGGATAQWPGAADCATVGSECPAGEFPEGLPADAEVLYVRAGGAPGGSGTADDPFGSIAEAMGPAGNGTVLALGRGTFDEPVQLGDGITLWGACIAETTITTSKASGSSGVVTASRSGTVRNLGITGERIGLFTTGPRADILVEDVIVASTRDVGITAVLSARLELHRVAVRDTRPGALGGRGIDVEGAVLVATDLVLERNADVGVIAFLADTEVTLENVAILDTASRALHAQDGARVTAGRMVVDRATGIAVSVAGDEATVLLEDAVIEHTLGTAVPGTGGRAVFVGEGGHLEARRLLAADNREAAVSVEAGTVLMEDLVVRDTTGEPTDGLFGKGVSVQGGGVATISRAVVDRSRTSGVSVDGDGSILLLTDARIRDTRSQESDGLQGRGLSVQRGAHAEVRRTAIERSQYGGFFVGAATATLEDVTISDTEGQAADGLLGVGLTVEFDSVVDARRLLLQRNRTAELVAAGDGTVLSVEDLAAEDTRSQASDGLNGRALNAQSGASVELARGRLERVREIAVIAFEGATVRATDLTVTDVLPRECVEDCGGSGGGVGLGAYESGALEVRNFSVRRAALCGVQLAREGAIDLHDGEVAECPIGANVQVLDYDLARLSDGVSYHDNERTFDASLLALPEPSVP